MRRYFPLLVWAATQWPAMAVAQPTVTAEDAKRWEIVSSTEISPDGRWAAVSVRRLEGTPKIEVRGTRTAEGWTAEPAYEPSFSSDSRWILFRRPSELMLRSLEEERELAVAGVDSYRYLPVDRLLAFSSKDRTLRVLDLASEAALKVEDVESYLPNPSGSLIAVATKAGNQGTLRLLDLRTNTVRTVQSGEEAYGALTWSKGGTDALAFVVSRPASSKVVVMTDLEEDRQSVSALEIDPSRGRVSAEAPLSLGTDLAVAFTIVPNTAPEAKEPAVEVWHSKDKWTYPERAAMAKGKAQGLTTVWLPLEEGRLVTLSQNPRQQVLLRNALEYNLITDTEPWMKADQRNYVYWQIDTVPLRGGERRRLLDRADNLPIPSPTGRYAAVFTSDHWLFLDVARGTTENATKELGVSFENPGFGMDTEMPEEQAQWLSDQEALIYDRYDAWRYRIGSERPVQLTFGRKDGLKYRQAAKLKDGLVFTTFDEKSKDEGLWRMQDDGKGEFLFQGPSHIENVKASEDGRFIVFTAGSGAKSPAVYAYDLEESKLRTLVETNPQQKDFAWGKSELVQGRTLEGNTIQGVLVYPAQYEASRRYPMVVVVYERQSDLLNRYMVPNPRAAYNPQVLSQNGYFVLLPDILFDQPRNPGLSAVKSVEAALDAVLEQKVGVDPAKVGVIGHSWGGYEAAFITTVSDRFAAGVCGSGLTDLASLSGLQYGRGGLPASVVAEVGQGRMQSTIWEAREAYLANSAVWQADKRKSPLLIQVGDQDDQVDWSQGLQLHNALRRLGKESILLVYRGEGHMLMKRENQEDYARRLRHFLDVHLKGAPAEEWLLPK